MKIIALLLPLLLFTTPALSTSFQVCSASCDPGEISCTPCPKYSPPAQNEPRVSDSSPSNKKPVKKCLVATGCLAGYTWSETACTCVPTTNPNTDEGSVFSAADQQCQDDSSKAFIACDQERDSNIQGAQTKISNFVMNGSSNLGISGSCSAMQSLMTGAYAAVAYFSKSCSDARTTCLQSCEQASAMAGTSVSSQTEVNLNDCQKLKTNIDQAAQAIQNLVASAQSAANCAKETSSDGSYDFCLQNPTALGCSTAASDCSNPKIAASNPICICKANPRAATCIGMQAKAGDLNSGSFEASSTTTTTSTGRKNDIDDLLGDPGYEGNGMTPSRNRAEDVGGAKGGRPLMGGSIGSNSLNEKSSLGADTKNSAGTINAGYRGGSGGGWGGSSGGGDSNHRQDRSGKSPDSPQARSPNLRDFLPNGKLDPNLRSRGMAGISGPDGITGPHSDIWKKIQNRYQVYVDKNNLIP